VQIAAQGGQALAAQPPGIVMSAGTVPGMKYDFLATTALSRRLLPPR
jgi:hypothetical protein